MSIIFYFWAGKIRHRIYNSDNPEQDRLIYRRKTH